MTDSTTTALVRQSTPHATLVVLGLKVHQLDLFRPIREQVHIKLDFIHLGDGMQLAGHILKPACKKG